MEVIFMAKIVQRGKSISVVFYLGNGDERTQKWESMPNRTIAKARMKVIDQALLDGSLTLETYVKPTKEEIARLGTKYDVSLYKEADASPVLRDYMEDEFIPKYGLRKWGHSYYRANLSKLENYIYPRLENVKLSKFTVKMIDGFYEHLLTEAIPVDEPNTVGLTNNMVHDIHKMLRCAFNKAKKWQFIDSNPFLDATVPERTKQVRDTLSTKELEILLKETDDPDDYDKYTIHVALNLAFACSLRGGELAALQWSDFDTQYSFNVYKSIDRMHKDDIGKCTDEIYFTFPLNSPFAKSRVVLKNTKTDGSVRKAYFSETVKKKLETLRNMQNGLKEMLGEGYFDFGMVICQAHGRPLMTEHLNKKFKSTLDACGIKEVVFHSLRSTSTQFKLRMSNGDIKAVQGENGHSDSKMVTDQYSRIVDEDRRFLADKMESVFYQGNNDEKVHDFMKMVAANPALLDKFMATVSSA
jgi:integrase